MLHQSQFAGTFDGQGHTISNLTIYDAVADNLGMFSLIGLAGTVRNVGLVGGSVTGGGGNLNVGTLAGSKSGTIDNVHTTGSVSGGDGADGIGGLVGWNLGGTIAYSYATGSRRR